MGEGSSPAGAFEGGHLGGMLERLLIFVAGLSGELFSGDGEFRARASSGVGGPKLRASAPLNDFGTQPNLVFISHSV